MQNEIKRLRTAKGVSQEKLGKSVYLTQHAISQIENEQRQTNVTQFKEIVGNLNTTVHLQVEDEETNRKVDIKEYFKGEKGLEREFPNWEFLHTGGHCYLLKKDFKTKTDKEIAVFISSEAVMVYKKLEKNDTTKEGVTALDEFVNLEEWNTNKSLYTDYEEFALTVLFYNVKEELEVEPLTYELFSKRTVDEIIKVSNAFLTNY